ncbi:MAG: hypothetical protein QOH50_5055 [Kribbellaceae bacterium]|nr:hypothetical protein [Kribbellaceae bacterium]
MDLGLATGKDSARPPWKAIGDNVSAFFDPACIPEGFSFQDPSRMGQSVKELVDHLRKREQEFGVNAFKFDHIKVQGDQNLQPAQYPENAQAAIQAGTDVLSWPTSKDLFEAPATFHDLDQDDIYETLVDTQTGLGGKEMEQAEMESAPNQEPSQNPKNIASDNMEVSNPHSSPSTLTHNISDQSLPQDNPLSVVSNPSQSVAIPQQPATPYIPVMQSAPPLLQVQDPQSSTSIQHPQMGNFAGYPYFQGVSPMVYSNNPYDSYGQSINNSGPSVPPIVEHHPPVFGGYPMEMAHANIDPALLPKFHSQVMDPSQATSHPHPFSYRPMHPPYPLYGMPAWPIPPEGLNAGTAGQIQFREWKAPHIQPPKGTPSPKKSPKKRTRTDSETPTPSRRSKKKTKD